ncbi:SURF1 family protein, partial [uncultured Jatrophihabitans sp.]|uniref:SURF1 family protein n=1 Tax=uncultured Jatrophihabitans sp. TaxID=1610747 RepID=UPI0035CAE036
MLRAAIWTLRQPRYAALGALMAVLFVACVGMGTFELHRFREKVDQNHRLKANARADVMPLSTSLVPLTGRGPAPGPLAVRFRTVSVTGSFEPQRQQYLADQSQGGDEGFYVVTPLRTDTGDLLVVRGFTPAVGAAAHPGRVAPPPTGVVQLQGRLQNAQSGDDKFARIGHAEISTINPTQQAQRSEVPTYAAYMTIGKGQPGTAGLRTLPPIKLSNPTGGAGELQLFSYILQWYVFALLAAAAPFLVSRVEIREARREYLGIDPERIQFDAPPEPAALDAGTGGGELAVRGTGELARMGIAPERRRRAARLADRYGRSLGMDALDPSDVVPRSGPVTPRPRVAPGLAEPHAPRRSAQAPHRVTDDM